MIKRMKAGVVLMLAVGMTVASLLAASAALAQPTERERVYIQDGNVVTDRGEPLRGARFWVDPDTVEQMNQDPGAFASIFDPCPGIII